MNPIDPQVIRGVGHTFSKVSDALSRMSDTAGASHSVASERQPLRSDSDTRYTDVSRWPSFSFLVRK